VSQTITGLVDGQQYTLTWEYGGRPGAGGEESMNVLLGGNQIATDSSGIVSQLTWSGNSYTFVAGPRTETLSFVGLAPGPGGNTSYATKLRCGARCHPRAFDLAAPVLRPLFARLRSSTPAARSVFFQRPLTQTQDNIVKQMRRFQVSQSDLVAAASS